MAVEDQSHSHGGLNEVLTASRLDFTYARAAGNHLITNDGRRILDLAQGAGAGLLGHNHPEILDTARGLLDEQVPFNAQFSLRPTGRLVIQRLSEEIAGDRKAFEGVWANSGAEANEAALKHALLNYEIRLGSLLQRARHGLDQLRLAVQSGDSTILPAAFIESRAHAGHSPRIGDVSGLRQWLEAQYDALRGRPVRFLALQRGFHGLTLGTLRTTHNPRFRAGFIAPADEACFAAPDDLRSFTDCVISGDCMVPILSGADRANLRLDEVRFSTFAAFIFEPIQGEGGIFPLSADFLRAAAALCRERGIPTIADEVQTFGRTGQLLACGSLGVEPDALTLAKAIGGSAAKAGLALIRRTQYHAEFERLHMSTFGGDEWSSRVALKTLDILTRDDALLLKCGAEAGNRLRDRLREVALQFPNVIVAVRGIGLMIGVEFQPLERFASWAIRWLGRQAGAPSLPLAAYLLHEHGVRVLPTLNDANTLRIEPSLFMTEDLTDQSVAAFRDLAAVLENENGGRFVRHRLGSPTADPGEITDFRHRFRPRVARTSDKPRAAFLCHPVTITDLWDFDPSLEPLGAAQCDLALRHYADRIMPEPIASFAVRDALGREAELVFIAVPFTSVHFSEALLAHDLSLARALIGQAVSLAEELGCSNCGLGQFTSIVTRNGRALSPRHIRLTTGNALTAGMAVEALWVGAARRGYAPEDSTVGVIGAGGNIGSVVAQLAADRCPRLRLIGGGRFGSESRLIGTAHRISTRAFKRFTMDRTAPLRGLTAVLAAAGVFEDLDHSTAGTDAAGAVVYRRMCERFGAAAPIRVEGQFHDVVDCELVVAAANAPEPFVIPDHVRPGGAVLCDVGVPPNIHTSVWEMGDSIDLIPGGRMQLPHGETIDVMGNHLPAGTVYACIAETIVLTLAGRKEHFSYGTITPEQVEQIVGLAVRHGFRLASDTFEVRDGFSGWKSRATSTNSTLG